MGSWWSAKAFGWEFYREWNRGQAFKVWPLFEKDGTDYSLMWGYLTLELSKVKE